MSKRKLIVAITGANSGMGFETAKTLADAGHTLILGVRNPDALKETIANIKTQSPDAIVHGFKLDLASFASVREWIKAVQNHTPTLDVLICNAGIMAVPYQKTADGFESQYQVNFLSHALISIALTPQLLAGNTKKCIHISSLSGEKGTLNQVQSFDEMGRVDSDRYDAMRSYRESKLAQTLFSKGQHLVGQQSGIWTASIHPGVVITNLFYRGKSNLYKWLMKPFEWVGLGIGFFVRPETGASTAIELAQTDDMLPSGRYWHNKKERIAHPSVEENHALCRALYQYAAEILNDVQCR
jgi:retinol dehydrogenase 12